MIALSLISCACPGESPTALYGSQQWEGPAGIAWLATFEGPGVLCEFSCPAPLEAAIVREDGPCLDEGGLELEEGEHAGLCVVIPGDFDGEADCWLSEPGGERLFSLTVWAEGRP